VSAANANTATATTDTGKAQPAKTTLFAGGNRAMSAESAASDFQPIYVGRFAPSPTGALHLGSLVAAVGSFLDARNAGGRWLLRMEDLDATRVIPGCSDEMLRTLEAFGLWWDGEVEFQSRRTALYAEALKSLRNVNLAFECSCTRRDLTNSETGYPGTCRAGPARSCGPTATRFRVANSTVSFLDRVQGECRFELGTLGDPVIRRRDGAFAYQLAVVVDDAAQSVSDVVRGADLLESTAWQIHLQEVLGLATPRYAHLPLIVENVHGKLSKSRRSIAIDPAHACGQLSTALSMLQHKPPVELERSSPATLLAWATENWCLDRVHLQKKIVVSTQMSHV
jgi:glutamyl-Q tRNA(Asp) synthetase